MKRLQIVLIFKHLKGNQRHTVNCPNPIQKNMVISRFHFNKESCYPSLEARLNVCPTTTVNISGFYLNRVTQILGAGKLKLFLKQTQKFMHSCIQIHAFTHIGSCNKKITQKSCIWSDISSALVLHLGIRDTQSCIHEVHV